MRRRASGPAGQSQRQLRVGEGVRHALVELLRRTHDPMLADASLTVSEVRVSPDLRYATVYVTELGGGLRTEVKLALERATPHLRGAVARHLHLKYAPRLTFVADESFEEAAKIEALLARERSLLERQHEDQDGSDQS